MTAISSTQLFFAVLAIALVSHVAGHSYMTTPTSRSNQAQSEAGCRGPACLGPCDIPLAQATRAPIAASRGQVIQVDWPRNNHAGGFIRFAWALTSQSDNHSAFDNHVQQINCHEIGNPTPGECAPSDPINDPNGPGSGPADGSSGACNTNITVPLDLTDGLWTLQWAWFGGAFSLGDYYSCADYKISGGAVGTLTPVFKGGDFTYPNQQKCKFFNTDKLHVCTDEPCQDPIFPAAQEESGPPAAGQLGAGIAITSASTPASTPSSTPAPAPTPVSTPVSAPVPAPVPVPTPAATGYCATLMDGYYCDANQNYNWCSAKSTYHMICPLGTGCQCGTNQLCNSPCTTLSTPAPSPVPTPTPSPVPTPTPSPVSLTTSQAQVAPTPVQSMTTGSVQSPIVQSSTSGSGSTVVSANCAGASSLSTSTARVVSIDSWGSQFHAIIEITVAENVLSDWVLEVTFPFSTQVVNYFNGGALQCTGSSTAYFTPAAAWSNNVPQGGVITIEFIATDNESSSTFIAGLRVLKH